MAILKKEEFMEQLKRYTGEDTSDETLKFLEDVSDTYQAWGDNETWKEKYEENDSNWRKRYKERFEEAGDRDERDNRDEEVKEKRTFEELFRVD